MTSVAIAGAGIFGVTAAVELARRGFEVTLVDPGPLPHPDASSTDTSKAVRADYGRDEFLMDFAAACLDGWRAWNAGWSRPLFHEVGILMLSPAEMAPGGFEAESYGQLQERGVPVERIDPALLARRFPAWAGSRYADGYFNPHAGWVESGAVVDELLRRARAEGVQVLDGVCCEGLRVQGGRVTGLALVDAPPVCSNLVIVAAGAWTPVLLPYLSGFMRATAQPVVYFEPENRSLFEGQRFPVWCADIHNTGWYGFPVTSEGELKIANHGPGRRFGPGTPQVTTATEQEHACRFAARAFPRAGPVRQVRSRLCLYCDSWDGDFLIDHDPHRSGLVVASGGSGHGLKFAPLLGGLIADVVERKPNPWAGRFAWRTPGRPRVEHARHEEREESP